MAQQRKIIYIIGSFNVGGAEKQLSMLASSLAKQNHQVHLFSLESSGPLRESLEDAGVNTHLGGYDSNAPRWQKILLLMRAQLRLLRLLFNVKPQVIHAFLPLTNFMGALAGHVSGVKIVITSRRALGTHQDRHRWWSIFDRLANRWSTVITGNSQAVIDDTIRRDRVAPGKMRLIYNGLNLGGHSVFSIERHAIRSGLGLTKEMVGIVYVANLIPYKGHLELIEAHSFLCRKRKNLRLFLIGEDRGIGDSLERRSQQLGVASSVFMLGRRNDVSRILSAMDIGVMASHEEGCSNALLEKLAAGLPVAATAVGGNTEVLSNMPGCVLSKPRSAEALAAAIEILIGKESLPSISARHRIDSITRRFSVSTMVDAHERLYWGNNELSRAEASDGTAS